ncbi:hypothetical protein CCICO_06255 [Corynebacterium ciconiae DSM 44920]|uniref:DUF421 domain-containing protein n=1 Tax=Corynebacterium ciconiae TaxID=227319 RepID=UPI0003715A38|nr:YetF domain-containing protein [Corynebacterium ciconiae]WKD61278.1 hypothetical protein CCICO_06255 [Corynebacterium ciconiae DSM 44920]
MWFDSWFPIIRALAVGTASYATLLLFLRVAGARSLAKLNAFDFLVTVAIGSILSTAMVTKDLSYATGIVAIAILLGLQYVVARAIRHSSTLREIVTADPIVVVREGQMVQDGMKKARVGAADIYQAARSAGQGDLTAIAAMIVETDGTISVITTDAVGSAEALRAMDAWK